MYNVNNINNLLLIEQCFWFFFLNFFFSDYTALFQNLGTLKGPASIQLTYVNDIIAEALRFKRKKLVNKLEEFRKSYMRIPTAAR